MRFIPISSALLLLCVLGCKPNKEALVTGTWKSTQGTVVTFKSDKTFAAVPSGGMLTETGTWKVDDGDCVMTPIAANGHSISQLKQRALTRIRTKPMTPAMRNMIEDMDKPNIFSISDDGKTMKTDKSRDTNSGEPWNLTKQGS